MANKARGLNAGKSLKRRRHHGKWLDKDYVTKLLNLKSKSDPLEGHHKLKE